MNIKKVSPLRSTNQIQNSKGKLPIEARYLVKKLFKDGKKNLQQYFLLLDDIKITLFNEELRIINNYITSLLQLIGVQLSTAVRFSLFSIGNIETRQMLLYKNDGRQETLDKSYFKKADIYQFTFPYLAWKRSIFILFALRKQFTDGNKSIAAHLQPQGRLNNCWCFFFGT